MDSNSRRGLPRNTTSSDINAFLSMVDRGVSPRTIIRQLAPSVHVPSDADEMMLLRLIVSMMDHPKRKKLPQYNTIDDAINLISRSKKIIVLSGAGISTSAGIPDFRSRNGIYVQIHNAYPDLEDPKSMFDIDYFRMNPGPFYQFAKALYPGQYSPTIGHRFIKCIEDHNKLLRNYTQNIDTLERQVGLTRVVECHGSFAKATCTSCGLCVDGDAIKDDVLKQKIPLCSRCHKSGERPDDGLGVMKPNIVFFGEQLGETFHNSIDVDKDEVDLLIVIGSSLKVKPVACIPNSVPAKVPQILINKEPLDNLEFDIELLGNCDEIIQELCLRLGASWVDMCSTNVRLTEMDGPRVVKCDPILGGFLCPAKNRMTSAEKAESKVSEANDDTEEQNLKDSVGRIQDDEDELVSFNQGNASESSGQKMIEELDNDCEREKCAMAVCDENSSESWEDIEIIDESSQDSPDDSSRSRATIAMPDNSYLFFAPNKYIFRGAELTNGQIESYAKGTSSYK